METGMLKFLAVLCVGSSLITMLSATEVIFNGLTLPSYHEEQKLTSLLRSEKAVYKGRFTKLNGISLEVYGPILRKTFFPQ